MKKTNAKPDLSTFGARLRCLVARGISWGLIAELPLLQQTGFSDEIGCLSTGGDGDPTVAEVCALGALLVARPEWLAFGTGRMSTRFAGPWAVFITWASPKTPRRREKIWVTPNGGTTSKFPKRIHFARLRDARACAEHVGGTIVRVGTRKGKQVTDG